MPVVCAKVVQLDPAEVKLLSTWRDPLTDMTCPERVLDIVSGALTSVTPGRIAVRPTIFRPLRGKSSTRRVSTTAARVAVDVLTIVAVLETVSLRVPRRGLAGKQVLDFDFPAVLRL